MLNTQDHKSIFSVHEIASRRKKIEDGGSIPYNIHQLQQSHVCLNKIFFGRFFTVILLLNLVS